MKKVIILILGVWLYVSCKPADKINEFEYSFEKTTYQFVERDGETLYLDRYAPRTIEEGQKTPCIMFVFGGAFARGARDVPKYIPYFDYLVKNGYTVISSDYRLGLKEASQQKGLDEETFAKHFVNAVNIAVEDFFDATAYVLANAEEWNIDPTNIIANGSSAGAVTVLQAEYAITNNTYNLSPNLPENFNYTGIIAFAGGIFVPQGAVKWVKSPCPIMMFHGDADLQVPFDKLVLGDMGLYGAKHIAETLEQGNYPYYFYQFDDYGHEIASDPIQENKEDVLWFLNTFIKEKKQYKVYKEQKEIGRPERDKDFGVQDYIKGNFDR